MHVSWDPARGLTHKIIGKEKIRVFSVILDAGSGVHKWGLKVDELEMRTGRRKERVPNARKGMVIFTKCILTIG